MPTFYVNQTKSYTLAVNAETGEFKLELADDLRENLKELLEEADTSTEAAAGVLDLLGNDGIHLVDAMDAIFDMDGALSAAHGAGGIEGMEAVMVEHAANNSYASDLAGRLAEKEGANGFGSSFVEIPSTDIGDYLDWGMPSEGGDADPSSFSPTYGLTQDSGGDDSSWGFTLAIVGGAVGVVWGGAAGAGIGTFLVPIPGAGTAGGAATGAAGVGAAGAATGYVVGSFFDAVGEWMDGSVEAGEDAAGGLLDDVEHIPADPNAEYEGLVDFTPPWVEAQLTEGATYGLILTDPNSEKGVEGSKDYNPEDELAREILTDPENVQEAIKAEQVQEAAEFGIVSTTMPAEPEFHFKPEINGKPPVNGGEDFSETEAVGDGSLMATATEYIIPLVTGEEQGVQLASDTMVFNATPEAGEVESEGTSGAMLEGQINEAEAGAYFPGEML